jgi:predicted DNA-binding transcriptional regulator YafY
MRDDTIRKCLKMIKLFERGCTIQSLADDLGVSERTSYRYLQVASLELPIYEENCHPKIFRLNNGQTI